MAKQILTNILGTTSGNDSSRCPGTLGTWISPLHAFIALGRWVEKVLTSEVSTFHGLLEIGLGQDDSPSFSVLSLQRGWRETQRQREIERHREIETHTEKERQKNRDSVRQREIECEKNGEAVRDRKH